MAAVEALQRLKKERALVEAARIARGMETSLYLVGGCLRDLLLGLNPAEYDFAVAGDAVCLGRAVAERLGGHFIPLDPARGICRVVFKGRGWPPLDFCAVAGVTITEDLHRRDFTVNAVAVDWSALALDRLRPALLDPVGGVADLERRRLRACSAGVFREDPLRLLRAARIGAQRRLEPDQATLRWMRDSAHLAARPAGERVKQEFFALLSQPASARWVRMLSDLGVLRVLLPEIVPLQDLAQGPPHRDPVWEHSLKVLEACELLLPRMEEVFTRHASEMKNFVGECLEERIDRAAALKLCALLHDAGKPATRLVQDERVTFRGHSEKGAELAEEIGRRLRLSNRTLRVLSLIVRHHQRPLLLSLPLTPPTRRAMYRFFRETAGEGLSVCLLALADEHSKAPEVPFGSGRLTATVFILLDYLRNFRTCLERSTFLSGKDLMARFNLAPGPRLGRILESLREAQGAGEVRDREGALAYVRRQCGEYRKGNS